MKTLAIVVWVLTVALCLNAEAQTRRGGEPSSPRLQAEEEREKPSSLVGMQAYREVLASGRYLVGPGDEFLIYITGMKEPAFGRVMAEGGLFVPSVGSVPVAGLSLREARQRLESAFQRVFQQGEITVELGKIRNFPIAVVGLVENPGETIGSGVERVSEIIHKAGGLVSQASRRNIRVVKTGELAIEERARLSAMENLCDYPAMSEIASRVDLELYGATGDSRYNPFVEDGDLILVPPKKGLVRALGAVQRGDFFEFVPGDRLSDLLTLTHGPAPGFDPDNVNLLRYTEQRGSRYSMPVDIVGAQAGDSQADLLLEAEDWLVVRGIPGFHQSSTVQVLGEVVYPGVYVVEKNKTTLRQLIEQVGGFTVDASLSEARVVRRHKEAADEEEVKDPEFERIAGIPVADRTDDDNQYYIMKSREKPGQMVVDFAALFEAEEVDSDITLMPDDVIHVPATLNTVIVSGQAARSGKVAYRSGYTVWDYIELAGGLGWRASTDIRVIKAHTGEMKRASNVVRIEPGDRIWIKEKPQRDYWEIFRGTMEVVGQVSTVVLLYATLR